MVRYCGDPAIQHLLNQNVQLKCNTLSYSQPMKLPHYGRDVLIPLSTKVKQGVLQKTLKKAV